MCAGLNNDCSVLFINMGEDDLFVFGNSVLIEWEEVGPVEDTECRLEQGDDIGEYFPCKWHVVVPDHLTLEYDHCVIKGHLVAVRL